MVHRDLGVGVAAEQPGARTEFPGIVERGENIGGASGCGDAENKIVLAGLERFEVAAGLHEVVFCAFDAESEGVFAAGHDTDDAVGRNAEGGRAFGSVENPEASAGACSEVDNASALGDGPGGVLDGAGDGVGLLCDGVGEGAVGGAHGFHDFARGHLIQRTAGRGLLRGGKPGGGVGLGRFGPRGRGVAAGEMADGGRAAKVRHSGSDAKGTLEVVVEGLSKQAMVFEKTADGEHGTVFGPVHAAVRNGNLPHEALGLFLHNAAGHAVAFGGVAQDGGGECGNIGLGRVHGPSDNFFEVLEA